MKRKIANKTKNKEDYLLYGLLVIASIVLIFSIVSFLNFQSDNSNQQSTEMHSASQMSLTAFDKQLARNLMDKNNDGLCDACGMDVSACIDSGQLQCNMDPKSTIGVLGSGHIHADFKVFINGNSINFANEKYHMKSSFIHVDDNLNKEDASSVLHMHATGVPLWIFFKSVGMDFNKESLTLPDGRKFSNGSKNTLKFYVNGRPNSEWENYVFSDLDKILISYGDETDMSQQLNLITDFANDHGKQGE
ncbi:MAG: hypothetical protein Q7J54_04215 [Candidatus Woesearchaeota archaeon]|nr:hypothetical protein [Candidatus Woesearchaeota archaeon]